MTQIKYFCYARVCVSAKRQILSLQKPAKISVFL